MIFVGDYKNPVFIGKYSEIKSFINEDFFRIIELWRWSKTQDLEITDSFYALGVRTIQEEYEK